MKIGGLRAVFGETYPDPVRVLSVGAEVGMMLGDSNTKWGHQFSVEFCGGTHVSNSDEIHRFVLQVEESVAGGVRRIVGVTGPQAYGDAMLRQKTLSIKLNKAAMLKGLDLDKIIAELRTEVASDKEVSLLAKKKSLCDIEKYNEGQKAAGKADKKEIEKKAKEAGEKLAGEAKSSAGDTFVAVVDIGGGEDAKVTASAMDAFSKKCDNKAVLLLSNSGGKLAFIALVP